MRGAPLTDLLFGLKNGVDYVALSFVRTAEDVLRVKEIIRQAGQDTPVIAKIEKHEAIENIEAIMNACDGIMVARGDLGVEITLGCGIGGAELGGNWGGIGVAPSYPINIK